VARHPAVAAEVQRLTLLHSPHDVVAQAEHVAARLLELTKSAEPAVALRAIAQWAKLAETGLLKPPAATVRQRDAATPPPDRARIVNELRAIYHRTLAAEGQHGNELVGSTRPEALPAAEGQSFADDALSGELAPASAIDKPLELTRSSSTDEVADGGLVLSEGDEGTSANDDEFEWVNVPGSFGKARKVRVRVR
jgi:hypothetical protein